MENNVVNNIEAEVATNEAVTAETNDNEQIVLTPAALLYTTLNDYGVSVGEWRGRLWEVIFNSFMDELITSGYLVRGSASETSED